MAALRRAAPTPLRGVEAGDENPEEGVPPEEGVLPVEGGVTTTRAGVALVRVAVAALGLAGGIPTPIPVLTIGTETADGCPKVGGAEVGLYIPVSDSIDGALIGDAGFRDGGKDWSPVSR